MNFKLFILDSKLFFKKLVAIHPFIAIFIINFTFLAVFYSKALFSPNDYLFASSGDALKNYYTYLFYIKKDTSFINSNCTNYPYGDFFGNLDSQPAISIPLKVIHHFVPSLVAPVGILNFLLVISHILTSFLIYLILKRFKVGKWYSIWMSILITMLSPQFYRLAGHYGLAYSFSFPLIFFLLIKYIDTKKLKYSLVIFCAQFFLFFLHGYIPIINASFLFIFYIFYLLKERKKTNGNVLVNVLIQVIFPVVLYFLLITILDTHANRSDSPAGIFYYTATPVSVFLPYDIDLMKPYSLLFNYNNTMFEGISYIGLLSNLFIVGMLLYFIFLFIKKQLSRIKEFFNNNWLLFLMSAIIILLFSMSVLYDLGFDILLKYIKPLRQFRVLGRFSWPFYYVIFIFSVITLYKVYEYFKLKKWSKVFLAIIIAIPLYESIVFQNNISSSFLNDKNIFESKYLPNKYKEILSKIDIQKYQAILPIPIFHYGSEDFMLEPESASQYNTMIIGYYTKLPFLSSLSGRTSTDEAKKIIQVEAPSFYYKEIVNDIHSNKPFLILHSKININEYEKEVLNKSTKIAEIDDIELLEISKEKLFEYDHKQIVKNYSIYNDSTFIRSNHIVTDTNAQVFYENFDDINSLKKQYSKGAYSCPISNDNTVYKFKIDKIDSVEDYELSFWTNNKIHGSTRYMVVLIEVAEDGKSDWLTYTDGRFCPVIYKDWSLVQLKFKARKNYTYELFIPYRRELYDSIYIDNLLIRPLKVDFYTVLNNNHNGIILYNNQVVETKIPYLLLKCSKEILVEEYTHEIKNSVEWFNLIKNDAKKLNKSIDEVIKANAEYMYYERAYDITEPKMFIIRYYTHVIKNDSSWLKSLVERPDNKGKNIEDVIYQNAQYMYEQSLIQK